MPIIPKGDNFGNAQIKAGRTNIQGDDGGMGRAMDGIGRTVAGIGLRMQHENNKEQDALNRVTMANDTLEYKKQVDLVQNDINQKLYDGNIEPEDALAEYNKRIGGIKPTGLTNLTQSQQADLNYQRNAIAYGGEQNIYGFQQKAFAGKAKKELDKIFTSSAEEMQSENADLNGISARFNNEAIDILGRKAYGDAGWQQEKQTRLANLDINYLQSQINYASEREDATQLSRLRNALLDDTQFTKVNALKRKQLLNQIDPLIDRAVGLNFGKQLSSGITGLITDTGNLDAANVFNAMIRRESNGQQFDKNGNPLTSYKGATGVAQVMPATAKQMAQELGMEFDEKRYKTSPTYNMLLGQAYYQKMLNRYGTPLMAAAAYNAGHGAVDKWIKRFGDPRKGEISEEDFLKKIPYKETREYVQFVAQKAGGVKRGKIDKTGALEQIENSSMNYEQKQYAKSELSKTIAIQEQQQKEQYQQIKDTAWTEIVEGGKSFDELDSQLVAALNISDVKAMRNYKPTREDDIREYEKALYQVNNGIDVDLYGEYNKTLTNGTIKTLINKQASLRNNSSAANKLFTNIGLFNDLATEKGLKHGTEGYIDTQNKTMAAIKQREQEVGRELNYDEIREVIQTMFVKGYKKDQWGWGKSSYFEIDDKSKFYIDNVKYIPEQSMSSITSKLKARGIEPTEELVIKVYNTMLQGATK